MAPARVQSPVRILQRGEKDITDEATSSKAAQEGTPRSAKKQVTLKETSQTQTANAFECLSIEDEEEPPSEENNERAIIVVDNDNVWGGGFQLADFEQNDDENESDDDDCLEEGVAKEVQAQADPDPSKYLLVNQKPKPATVKRVTRNTMKNQEPKNKGNLEGGTSRTNLRSKK
ncbi:hypothetical protein FRX31_025304 [Thalictrum thalictroides]|uniref:Uncharacterized protein n=1 Tax=Thalictrum thalictroides TaxID=46969 RepID=A0A7J6VLA6_THATH|nr:hypothetical protein FRX31_025304 [Thalictrum thalictroides]